MMENRRVSDNLVCPRCHSILSYDDNRLSCLLCRRDYPLVGGIPDFREKDEYWCNVSREKMRRLNNRAKETGDWLNSAKEIIPEYTEHFIPFYRADSQFLWPTDKDSVILDAGSMWGGLTVPVAQFHREVYAVDKTVETLEFLKVRAEQMGFKNIHVATASLKSLPFPDNFFDHVVLNGVLEWVGLEEDTILEKHWKGKRDQKRKYVKSPEEIQLDVLKELRRVLKPTGSIYIAIENRYGVQYFLSCPDDHNNVRFITFLPRFLANMISKIAGKGEYRTYVYSPKQLANLLRKSGFEVNSMYGVFPHYIKIKKAFPLDMARLFKNEVRIDGAIPRVLHKIVKSLIPKFITQYVSPSLFAICRKNNADELLPRIQNLLIKTGIIKRKDRIRFVISNNRYENFNSTNIIIYGQNNYPLYFCKIARYPKISGLQVEAENLKWTFEKMLKKNELNLRIPELLYFGVVDGIEVLVISFLDAKNFKLKPHYIINKGFDKMGITSRFFRANVGFVEEEIFLKRIDAKIFRAINALIEFQQITSNEKTTLRDAANNIIDKYFKYQRNVPDEIRQNVLKLKGKIDTMPDIDIFTCSAHGDYDFDNVLFFSEGKVGLVDFEHLEKVGYPFFDLVLLTFNPLLIKWKSGLLKNESFAKYLNQYGGIKYIKKWLKYYCDKQNLPYSLIPIIPLITAVEQNTKVYPSFRDSSTYPTYGESVLKEFLSINLDEK